MASQMKFKIVLYSNYSNTHTIVQIDDYCVHNTALNFNVNNNSNNNFSSHIVKNRPTVHSGHYAIL